MTESLAQRFPIGSRWIDGNGDHHVVLGHDEERKTVKTYCPANFFGFSDVADWYEIYRMFEPYVEPKVAPDFERYISVDDAGRSDGALTTGYLTRFQHLFKCGVRNGEPFIERVDQ